MLFTDRGSIIKQYLKLADNMREAEYLYEQDGSPERREQYESAIRVQYHFYARHKLTRVEIDEHMKRGVKRFDNAHDAMKAVFG